MPEIDPAATAWLLASTALVLLMTPGLAIFYGGMVAHHRRAQHDHDELHLDPAGHGGLAAGRLHPGVLG